MAAPRGKRPITRALDLVKATTFNFALDAYVLESNDRDELIRILDAGTDATRTHSDSQRKRHRPKASTKRAAKKTKKAAT